MGAFRVLLGSLHYVGLCVQLSVCTRQAGHGEIENRISGNAMFTEVPHDMTAQRGQDVEMACSFRGAGMPSYSLEIQWWYIRNHMDWTDQQPWTTNEVSPDEEMPKDSTKISVVKVVGSNISHKLRLSRVKQSDEGTYECRVIDFSDVGGARHHRVRAQLQVVPETHISDNVNDDHSDNFEPLDDTKKAMVITKGPEHHAKDHIHHQSHSKRPSSNPAPHHGHSHNGQQHKPKEMKRRDSSNDCADEASCAV
ncbi:V-set and transmembrane domain-containing protein 2-like protein [Eucyclogobius newberryi]|uniref:V-set and transmembrane domain-containing protein 2-like protein n=1 Tax=Eucyclogobius newberryi TaxID=166745 RepID=UPI003B5AF850